MRIDSTFRSGICRRIVPLLLLVFAHGGVAADVQSGIGVRLGAGYDSNPLLVTDDGTSGAFALMDFDARLDATPSPALGVFVRSDGWARSHAASVGNADVWGGEARAGISLPRLGTERRRLALAIGARAATRHDTFLDRATGEVYRLVVTTTPPSSMPIPDRFDSQSAGAFVNARYRTSPRVLLSLDARVDAVNYTKDYDSVPSLSSLDFQSTSLEPGVYLKISDPLSVGVSLVLTGIDYDQQPALDASGSPVAGTVREYGSRELRLVMSLSPRGPWGARFGHRRMDRDDAYAGYYSYGATTSFLTLDRKLGAASRIEFSAVRSALDYEHAVVPGSTDGAIQASGFTGVTARFDTAIGASPVRWFSEAGMHRADSHDPVYAYDRQWVLTGIEFRR